MFGFPPVKSTGRAQMRGSALTPGFIRDQCGNLSRCGACFGKQSGQGSHRCEACRDFLFSPVPLNATTRHLLHPQVYVHPCAPGLPGLSNVVTIERTGLLLTTGPIIRIIGYDLWSPWPTGQAIARLRVRCRDVLTTPKADRSPQVRRVSRR